MEKKIESYMYFITVIFKSKKPKYYKNKKKTLLCVFWSDECIINLLNKLTIFIMYYTSQIICDESLKLPFIIFNENVLFEIKCKQSAMWDFWSEMKCVIICILKVYFSKNRFLYYVDKSYLHICVRILKSFAWQIRLNLVLFILSQVQYFEINICKLFSDRKRFSI